MYVLNQFHGNGKLLCLFEELIFAKRNHVTNLLVHLAHMANCLNDVARARLALGADHSCAFGNAAKSFAQVACAAYEGNRELGLVDVIGVVSRREYLGFVDVINFDSFKQLSFDEMTDAAFSHNGDGNGFLDALDHLGVAHAGDATSCADVGRDALKCHNCAGACLFGDSCLFGRGYVHDYAALEHLCQLTVQFNLLFGGICFCHVRSP